MFGFLLIFYSSLPDATDKSNITGSCLAKVLLDGPLPCIKGPLSGSFGL